MSKAILPEIAFWESFFWPSDVPRYNEVVYSPLYDLLVARWAKSEPNRVALLSDNSVLTFGDLDNYVRKIASGISNTYQNAPAVPRREVEPVNKILYALACFLVGTAFPIESTIPLSSSKPKIDSEMISKWISSNKPAGLSSPSVESIAFLHSKGENELGVTQKSYDVMIQSYNSFFQLTKDNSLVVLFDSLLDDLFQVLCSLARGSAVILTHQLSNLIDMKGLPTGPLHVAADSQSLERLSSSGIQDWRARSLTRRIDWITCLDSRSQALPYIQKRTGVPFINSFRLPEIGVITANHPSWPVPSSIGIPITNIEVRLLNKWNEVMLEAGTVGKLVVSGPFVEEFTYLHGWTDTQFVTVKGPRKSSMRWLNTGIQAEMDENGLLYVRN